MTSPRLTLSTWHVTVIDRGYECNIAVQAANAADAKREALVWHPGSKIIHVERESGS